MEPTPPNKEWGCDTAVSVTIGLALFLTATCTASLGARLLPHIDPDPVLAPWFVVLGVAAAIGAIFVIWSAI